MDETDKIYIRWDTRLDTPYSDSPIPISTHKSLEEAIARIPPLFIQHERTPNPESRYIRDFIWEAIEEQVLPA